MKDSRGEHQTNAGIQQDYPTPKLLFALYQQQRQKSQLNHQGKKHPSKDLKASHLVEGEAAGGEGQRQGSRMVPSAGSGGDAQPRCQPGGQGASRCGGTAAAGEHTDTHPYTQGFVDVQSGRGKAAAATTVPEGPGRGLLSPLPERRRRRPRERGQTRGSAPQSAVWRVPGRLLESRNNPGAQRQGEIPSHHTSPLTLQRVLLPARGRGGRRGSAPRRQRSAGAGRAAEQPRRAERSGAEPSSLCRAPAPPRPQPQPAAGAGPRRAARSSRTRGTAAPSPAARSRLPPPAHCTAHAVQRC